jgi:probable phosphoglycerate mutase
MTHDAALPGEGPGERQTWLARHGETEWSSLGRHTGRTDVPLTTEGEEQARRLGALLRERAFALVLTSPLSRAAATARIAGFGDVAVPDPDLQEWDYGDLEGRTTPEIRETLPGWTIWRGPVPNGESIDEVAARADRVVARLRAADGDSLVFAHGHFLRVLAARWLGLPATAGAHFALSTATTSLLGWERGEPVIERWNEGCASPPG